MEQVPERGEDVVRAEMEMMPQIMKIIRDAQAALAEDEIPQWQDGYPDEAVLRRDVTGGNCYVLRQKNEICAVGVLQTEPEPSYRTIMDGAWGTGERYGTVHRMAVARNKSGQGAAGRLYDALERICRKLGMEAVRIDTHRKNDRMRNWILKQGFWYCGVIRLNDGENSLRDAFEKSLV